VWCCDWELQVCYFVSSMSHFMKEKEPQKKRWYHLPAGHAHACGIQCGWGKSHTQY